MKRTNILPDWFDLNNYKASRSFTNSDWLRQLRYRSSALIDLDVLGELDTSMSEVEEIRRCGLPSKSWDDAVNTPPLEFEEQLEIDRKREEKYGYKDLGNSAVFPIQTLLMANIGQCLSSEINEIFSNPSDKLESIMSKEPFDVYASKSDYFDFDDRAFIMLDMSLPDTEIIECFKEFLPRYRKVLGIQPIKKRPTETTIYSCQKYNILAYLDLLIWELEHGSKIKRSVMAIALYPDGLIGDLGIAQTVHPFALEVTSEAFLKSLKRNIKK